MEHNYRNHSIMHPKISEKIRSHKLKRLVFGIVLFTLLVFLLNPNPNRFSEAKKYKEKKILKQLVKGLIVKNLSTKKKFLPLPVPIPVPIELSEPPVYLKGKPQYVTIYKPVPVVPKPTTVYHMPIYSPTYEYMMNPISHYDPSMVAASMGHSYYNQLNSAFKQIPSTSDSYSQLNPNFTDFDDEFGNYYMRKTGGRSRQMQANYDASRRTDSNVQLMPTEEQESLDHDDKSHLRVRRQALQYESGYDKNPPCYGFPLEVNIRSRIKPEKSFPILGNSQIRKCVRVGLPRLPVIDDHPSY